MYQGSVSVLKSLLLGAKLSLIKLYMQISYDQKAYYQVILKMSKWF